MSRKAPRGNERAETDETAEEQETSPGGGAWEQVSTIVFAILIALAIRAFVIEPYRIPSGSMFPTLLIGDHLFVNKFVYGVKLPFTDWRSPGIRAPERGDVVVFTVAKLGGQTYPADRKPELPREEFVKRIIGISGDRIEFSKGKVLVNGEPVPERPLPEEFVDDRGRSLLRNEVTLDRHTFVILDDPRIPAQLPKFGSLTVEEGRYFMLGDNRDHSKDSRFWGTVRLAEIKGPAFVLYWSWNFNGGWGELLNPLTWWELLTNRMRWERIGDGVP